MRRRILQNPLTGFLGLALLNAAASAAIYYSGNTIEIDQRNDRVILEGNAHMVSGSNDLRAHKVTIFQREKWAVAEKKVVLYNKDKKTRFTGDEIVYYYDDGICIAAKNPFILNEKDKVMVSGKVIKGYMHEDKAYAYTNVYLYKFETNDWVKAWGDSGYFEKALSYGRLTSNCHTEQEKTDTWSRELTVYNKTKQLFLDRDVKVYDYDSTNRAKTNELTAERVRYDYGDSGRSFYAYTNILMTDSSDGTRIGGNFMKNNPDTRYTYVSDRAFLVSGDKLMSLASDLLERFEYSDLLYAKGNVRISNENRRAFSSMAVFYKSEKRTVLYGNPRLEDETGTLYAERISFRSEDKNFRMEGQIRGAWSKM
ncbi:MAG: hypothetical protein JNM63_06835 [Spirochaetia bacterium]|nr:hypothetical protein [Spirochaetia bacterium]